MTCFSLFLSNAWLAEPSMVFVRVSSRLTCAILLAVFFVFLFVCFLLIFFLLVLLFASFRLFALLLFLFAFFVCLPSWRGGVRLAHWGDQICGVVAWGRLFLRRDISFMNVGLQCYIFWLLERFCSGFGEA